MAEVGKRFLEYQLIVDNPNPVWKSENLLRFNLPQFTFLLLCMIALTRIIHYILRPFNQPHFVAEFLAGLLVCPQLVAGTIAFTFVAPPKALLGIETMGHLGLIYNVFLTGLEMNLDAILLARRMATTIAMVSTIIPMLLGAAIYSMAQALYKGPNLDMSLYNTPSAYLFWALVLSVTNFPVLAHILADLKILYTELGRLAVTAATISDFYNWAMFVLLIPFACHSQRPFLSVILTIFFVLFCYLVLRPFLTKLLNKETENNEWDNYKLSYVLVGVLACAQVTEILGTHSVVGALVYGLMLPRGKFSDMLIERSDDLVSMYLEPLFFVGCGIRFDFSSFKLHKVLNVIIIIVMSCFTKIVSTVITAWFYGMPFRDGVALGALLNTKGILPLVMLNIAIDRQILSRDFYTIMVVASVVMTILVTPTINFIYKPRKQFKKNKLRTVQNLKADADIRIMVCVHNPRHATGMMSILEACSCANATHLRVFALQLIELKGRGTAFLIDEGGGSQQSQADTESIRDIFSEFKLERGLTNASVETLAAVSSYETIHKDIYNIADERQTSLILLPFHKHSGVEGALEETNPVFREINRNVMRYAPCSVGILVDRGHRLPSEMNMYVAIVFIGGPDDREALAIAWRMARHKRIHLSMVNILLFGKVAEVDTSETINDEANGILSPMLDSVREKELDEEYMSLFRLMAVNNEHSVTYSEKEVHTADDIPLVLDELEREGYDLYVLGHGKRRNSTVLSKLLEWTDCPELGVMGDMLASNTLGSCSSVLVVQQYGFGGMNLRSINQTTCESNDDDIEAIFKVKSIKYNW